MNKRFPYHRPALWIATHALLLLLLGGCATLQVDVDVYKGPLAHEREIQLRQYASMAISAKPLLQNLLCNADKAVPGASAEATVERSADSGTLATKDMKVSSCTQTQVEKKCSSTEKNFKSQFLCEVLALYGDQGDKQNANYPAASPGLDKLTKAVTEAMATSAAGLARKEDIDLKVDALNDALIFFAQKMLYVTNNELLYGGVPKKKEQQDSMIAVLQSLGNTILVHANDLRRQNNSALAQKRNAGSESKAVQQAFEPEASATIRTIIVRLQRFIGTAAAAERDTFISTATTQQQDQMAKLQKQEEAYQTEVASLLAIFRTVSAEPPVALQTIAAHDVDLLSAERDRVAIAALFNANASANMPANTAAAPLQPLVDWLERELADGVVTSPKRPDRLQRVKLYLASETERLAAFGIRGTTRQNETLAALQRYLKAQVDQADLQMRSIAAQAQKLQGAIDQQDQQAKERIAKAAAAARTQSEQKVRDKMVSVVESVRAGVLAEAEQLKVRDPQVILSLLRRKIEGLALPDSQTKLAVADINLTRTALENFSFPRSPCHSAADSANCATATSIEVLDNLIASLRARRLQAIASGDTQAARDLLSAINVAYEQRTSMIYLRPASDYLRSVYSSNQLTDNVENEERNLLVDWFKKYLNPAESDKKHYARSQLEKMHWQNVNKVTVTGGGNTNYVLAKDDVGNWYVKAYGADPEAIIKSATSLALFNSGKAINVNLLRRFEVQRKLDDDSTLSAAQRDSLKDELAASNKQGGASLLKVRDRYAARYQRDTVTQANALLVVMNELPAKSTAAIATIEKWPDGAVCTAKTVDALLKPLQSKYLDTPSARLLKASTATADPAKAAAQLEETEKSIQAALTAIHLYSADAQRTLLQAKIEGCGDAQSSAATLVRSYARAQVAAAAAERKLSIERYEDALSSVLEIAAEK